MNVEHNGPAVCNVCECPAEENRTLDRCPICAKAFCGEHAYLYSGRKFCGHRCAQYFFFGDTEDAEYTED